MGTRALTRIFDDNIPTSRPLLTLYRQMDGYPDGHGADLRHICRGVTIVNGMCSDDPIPSANGMGCLAAQIVAALKTERGGHYVTHDCSDWSGYAYEIRPSGRPSDGARHLLLRVLYAQRVIYDGTFDGWDGTDPTDPADQ